MKWLFHSQTSAIEGVCWSFIPNKTTFTKYSFTRISKLPRSFEIHWVRQYLVNFTGLAGILNATVYKTEPNFTLFWHFVLIFIHTASMKLKAGYTGFNLSVCPSVPLSICPSVDRILSALYLQQYSSDPFLICTSYQATSEGVSRVMFVSKFKNCWQIL